MADGFGRVPVEAEVAAGDGKVGGDGEFFAGTRAEQGAVVADAEAQDAGGGMGCAAADLAEQGQFPALAVAQGAGLPGSHFLPGSHSMRIGQTGGGVWLRRWGSGIWRRDQPVGQSG